MQARVVQGCNGAAADACELAQLHSVNPRAFFVEFPKFDLEHPLFHFFSTNVPNLKCYKFT
jgi:hypothetical protein